jgi:hypothetical protein
MVSAYPLSDVGLCAADNAAGGQSATPGDTEKNATAVSAEQPDSVQSLAGASVPLRVPEIRRLLGRLVLAVRQTVGHILEWSAWRRWHQGVAQYYHYKRRTDLEVQL